MKIKFLLLISLTLFTLNSCKNKCKSLNCNTGACVDGTCDCPAGTSGVNCEIVDPCYNKTCLNGGTCVDGTCNCIGGYYGEDCSVEIRQQYFGTYTGISQKNCPVSGNVPETGVLITVTAGSTVPEFIISAQNLPALTATVTGSSTFSIPVQAYSGFTYFGTGTYNGGSTPNYLNFNLTIQDSFTPENCNYFMSASKF